MLETNGAVAHLAPSVAPADEWLAAPHVFGWLAMGRVSTVTELFDDVRNRKRGWRDTPELDKLAKQHDIVLEQIRQGGIRAYVVRSGGAEAVALPSHPFSRGLTIGIFHGKVDRAKIHWPQEVVDAVHTRLPPTAQDVALAEEYDRLQATEAASDAAFEELKAAGMTGEVWFKRDDINACFSAPAKIGTPPVPPGMDGNFVSSYFKRANTEVQIRPLAEWIKWLWPSGDSAPGRDELLKVHRDIFGDMKGVQIKTMQRAMTEAWGGRTGGAPSHRKYGQPAA
jgi:hypothetical protein